MEAKKSVFPVGRKLETPKSANTNVSNNILHIINTSRTHTPGGECFSR